MEGSDETQKKFSYPNADRPINEPSPALVHPLVHLSDALNQEKNKNPDQTERIHTFQSDVAGAVKNDNVSMIKIALAEKKRQEKQGTYDEVAEKRNYKGIIIGIIIIIILGGLGIGGWYVWGIINNGSAPATNVVNGFVTLPAPIEAEQKISIDVTNKYSSDIEKNILNEKNLPLGLGSIKQIIFTSKIGTSTSQVTSAGFLKAITARIPGQLERALDPNFFFGIYSYTPHDSFLLYKVASYDNAYAGMLAWEPYMQEDLRSVIVNKKIITDVASSTATTSVAAASPESSIFIDRVINNKDVRLLYNTDGSIKLLYSFIDQSTLIITSSDKSLKEVILRLTTGRISR